MFGNAEVWRGMGVLLDSFDNDGLVRGPKGSVPGQPVVASFPSFLCPDFISQLWRKIPFFSLHGCDIESGEEAWAYG